MPTFTPNMNLRLPERGERVSLENFWNNNYALTDAYVAQLKAELEAEIASLDGNAVKSVLGITPDDAGNVTFDSSNVTYTAGQPQSLKDVIQANGASITSINNTINGIQVDVDQAQEDITALQTDVSQAQADIDNLQNLGHFVGSFPTYADLPANTSSYGDVTPTINDIVYVQADENHEGAMSRYAIQAIAADGAITYGFVNTFGGDTSGFMDKFTSPVQAGRIPKVGADGGLEYASAADMASAMSGQLNFIPRFPNPSPTGNIPMIASDGTLTTATSQDIVSAIGDSADFLPSGGTADQYLRGDRTWDTLPESINGFEVVVGNINNGDNIDNCDYLYTWSTDSPQNRQAASFWFNNIFMQEKLKRFNQNIIVRFKSGTYNFDDSLQILDDSTPFFGVSIRGNCAIFDISGTETVIFRTLNLSIEGIEFKSENNCKILIYVNEYVENEFFGITNIKNCKFYNTTLMLSNLNNALLKYSNVFINNCSFTLSNTLSTYYCLVINNTYTASDIYIYISNVNFFSTVKNNSCFTISNCVNTIVIISKCTFSGNFLECIDLFASISTLGKSYVSINMCNILTKSNKSSGDTYSIGIRIRSSIPCTISECIFSNSFDCEFDELEPIIIPNSCIGIYITTIGNCSIEKCSFYNTSTNVCCFGILVTTTSYTIGRFLKIINNKIFNYSYVTQSGYVPSFNKIISSGIYIDSKSSTFPFFIIDDNNISNLYISSINRRVYSYGIVVITTSSSVSSYILQLKIRRNTIYVGAPNNDTTYLGFALCLIGTLGQFNEILNNNITKMSWWVNISMNPYTINGSTPTTLVGSITSAATFGQGGICGFNIT